MGNKRDSGRGHTFIQGSLYSNLMWDTTKLVPSSISWILPLTRTSVAVILFLGLDHAFLTFSSNLSPPEHQPSLWCHLLDTIYVSFQGQQQTNPDCTNPSLWIKTPTLSWIPSSFGREKKSLGPGIGRAKSLDSWRSYRKWGLHPFTFVRLQGPKCLEMGMFQ